MISLQCYEVLYAMKCSTFNCTVSSLPDTTCHNPRGQGRRFLQAVPGHRHGACESKYLSTMLQHCDVFLVLLFKVLTCLTLNSLGLAQTRNDCICQRDPKNEQDSLEARRWMNDRICSFVEYDEDVSWVRQSPHQQVPIIFPCDLVFLCQLLILL